MSEKYKVLIVDDEEDIIEVLKYNLEREGYKVKTALDGDQAIKMAYKFEPHLIILDIMMPGMDGIEVCQKLRSDEKFANTLIAFLTARNESFTQISALETGGDDFINKPIKPSVFIARVHALMRRHQINVQPEGQQTKVAFGDLIIDEDSISVSIKGEEISLAKKEFELLTLLASKPGKVFNRNEILSKIWGNDVIVGDRTIDVHIRKLREKIGDDYIKTMKGVGYKFNF
jgi:two-component system alkaline phosphatase synthesis response regulator PhoP